MPFVSFSTMFINQCIFIIQIIICKTNKQKKKTRSPAKRRHLEEYTEALQYMWSGGEVREARSMIAEVTVSNLLVNPSPTVRAGSVLKPPHCRTGT